MPRTRYLAVFGFFLAFFVATAFGQQKKDLPKAEEIKKDVLKKDEAKKDETKKDETKKTEPAKKDEVQVEAPTLTWKFTPGTSFFQKMTTTTEQSIKVMGLDVTQKQEQTFYFKWTPAPVDKDADRWNIKQEIEGITMKIDIAGNPVSYDSTQESPPSGANTALAEFFKTLKGSSFNLTYNSKTQKIEKVEGRDEFLKKLATANPTLEPLLRKILSPDALKQMADPTFGMLPPTNKKVGETWESDSTLNLGPLGTYVNKYVYTLKGPDPVNKDLEAISVATTLTYTQPTDSDPSLPFKIKSANLKTKEKQEPGKILFNRVKGRLESSDFKLLVSGTLTIEIGGNSTAVDLTQTQESKVTTSDKSLLPEPPKKQ